LKHPPHGLIDTRRASADRLGEKGLVTKRVDESPCRQHIRRRDGRNAPMALVLEVAASECEPTEAAQFDGAATLAWTVGDADAWDRTRKLLSRCG
jgi:hypothetical protein